jgi:hypothetical protein
MIKSNKKHSDYIFILLLLLNGGSVIKVLGYTSLLQAATCFIMFILLLNNGLVFIKKTGLTIMFLIVTFLGLHLFHVFKFNLGTFFNNQVLNFFTLIVMGVFVGNQFFNRNESFILKLNSLLKILIIHAIFSCLLISLFPTKNILFKTVDEGAAYVGYFYVFFQRTHIFYTGYLDETMKTIFGFNFYRAHGIFWEPGVFATFVNIYVFINFFVLKNIKALRYALPAILLSWSTAGISVFLLQSSFFLVDYKRREKKFLIKKIFIGALAFFFMWITVVDNYNNKLTGDGMGSAAQRYMDTMGAVEVIKNNLFMGVGVEFKNFEKQMKGTVINSSGLLGSYFNFANKDEINFSNSFLKLFVYFGVIIGILLLYALYKQTLIPNKKWLFLLITILSVSSSPILFLGFHFTLIVSGLRNTIPFLRQNRNKQSLKHG